MNFFDEADLVQAANGAGAFLSLVVGRSLFDITRPEAAVAVRDYSDREKAAVQLMSLALYRALDDRTVTLEETKALAHLQWLLDLPEDSAYRLREQYVYPYYQNAFAVLLRKGPVADTEIHATSVLAQHLRLSNAEAEMLMQRAVSDGFAALPSDPGL